MPHVVAPGVFRYGCSMSVSPDAPDAAVLAATPPTEHHGGAGAVTIAARHPTLPPEDSDMVAGWPPGGGELGARVRATDWARTRLGPTEQWPKSLRTTLGIVLGSRFPMLLWWGPDFIQLYNDAYRPILRDKHPAALGVPAAQAWAEIWEHAGPMARGVLGGGPATWSEGRQLFIHNGDMLEESYFTSSASPVPGDDGKVGGVLNTVQETTEKMQSERELRMLHELSARAGEARTEVSAYRIAAEVLGANELDFPFALLYARGERSGALELIATGWSGDGLPSPSRLVRTGDDGPWPLAEVARTGRAVIVDDLAARLGTVPVGRWHTRTERAIVLPLTGPGATTPSAFLVAGVSPHRKLGDRYRAFFQATADQVAAMVSSARAYETESRRAESLAALDRSKTAFFANVSHEFRTPLTLMLGPIEDALASPEHNLAGEALTMVKRNALRLLRLVNSLLEVARAEAGRTDAAFGPTDLGALTAELAGGFRAAIERAGLALKVACEPLPEAIYVDVDLWEKIVFNLLSNALKFTFTGAISVAVRWQGDHAELEIADTGTGIAEDELPYLFQRFHRVTGATSRSHEGSGIGLALVHNLVWLHGGTIGVSSRPGAGTTFTIAIPRGSAHLPTAQVVATAPTAPAGRRGILVDEALRWTESGTIQLPPTPLTTMAPAAAADRDRPRVLIVDDNADLRAYLARLLAEDYQVDTAVDGEAGLAAARRAPPALVGSDIMMPRLDGFGLLRALRDDPALRKVPVILLSARAGEEATALGLDRGADDYLVKPFAARELLARVRTHLALARERDVVDRFFRLSLDMMAIAGVDGYFRRVSPAFAALGWTEAELLARPFLDFVHPDDVAATLAEVEQLSRNVPTIHFENRYRCRDGSYRWLAWTSAPDPHGTLYAIARDVTERRRSQDELARAQDEALSANRELEAFSYSVAHDLRSPLRSIDGFSQALLEDYAEILDADGKRYLGFVRESAQQMAALIDDLLALSRVTRTELDRGDVDLSALARATISRLQRAQPDRDLTVTIEDGLRDRGDGHLLAVVFDNLIGNAWKFTGKRADARIEVGATTRDGRPAYFVRDNGAGFDMAFAGKLFGVFQRLHAASEFEGTGVGLATVRRVLHRHGGRVWAEGAVEQGATFYFTLAATEPASDESGPRHD